MSIRLHDVVCVGGRWWRCGEVGRGHVQASGTGSSSLRRRSALPLHRRRQHRVACRRTSHRFHLNQVSTASTLYFSVSVSKHFTDHVSRKDKAVCRVWVRHAIATYHYPESPVVSLNADGYCRRQQSDDRTDPKPNTNPNPKP